MPLKKNWIFDTAFSSENVLQIYLQNSISTATRQSRNTKCSICLFNLNNHRMIMIRLNQIYFL